MSAPESPLFDPILMNSGLVQSGGLKTMWDRIHSWDWTFILMNIVVPIIFILYMAFSLRQRYDEKKARYEEYLVVADHN